MHVNFLRKHFKNSYAIIKIKKITGVEVLKFLKSFNSKEIDKLEFHLEFKIAINRRSAVWNDKLIPVFGSTDSGAILKFF